MTRAYWPLRRPPVLRLSLRCLSMARIVKPKKMPQTLRQLSVVVRNRGQRQGAVSQRLSTGEKAQKVVEKAPKQLSPLDDFAMPGKRLTRLTKRHSRTLTTAFTITTNGRQNDVMNSRRRSGP